VNHQSFFVPQPSPCPVATNVGRGPFALYSFPTLLLLFFFFTIETHTLEFSTPLIILMYLFGTILLIQRLDKMMVMSQEGKKKMKK
jgi:hypothetical protein